MAKMDYREKALERLSQSFKWARNNSIMVFEVADVAGILDYVPPGASQHTVLYQLQCLLTTTDTYYRRMAGHPEKRFGLLVRGNQTLKKAGIPADTIRGHLKSQMAELEELWQGFDRKHFEEHVHRVQAIINHEYLHQGQLVVMFRQADVRLPERFRKAFDL